MLWEHEEQCAGAELFFSGFKSIAVLIGFLLGWRWVKVWLNHYPMTILQSTHAIRYQRLLKLYKLIERSPSLISLENPENVDLFYWP